jgi:hypothetical protein
MPEPYPKIVLWGLAAGGNAGKASLPPTAPLPRPDTREAGREVGADGELEAGIDEDWIHGTVVTLPVPTLGDGPAVGGGRSGNGLLEGAKPEAVPQDRVRETVDWEDWAVDDLSLRTRVDFAADGFDEDEPEPEPEPVLLAQPSGIELLVLLVTGNDG